MLTKAFALYRTFAILLLNTILLIIAVNGVLYLLSLVKDSFFSAKNEQEIVYTDKRYYQVYPQYTQEEFRKLLTESGNRPVIYDPFTQFRENEYKGTYFNVTPQGYRITDPKNPWPPSDDAFNIFVFGGSTTFGYSVADTETIPYFLQKKLRAAYQDKQIHVYNFGQGFFYSSQELIFFERLLATGYKPDMAIFIDGFNDFSLIEDKPAFTDEFREYQSPAIQRQNRIAIFSDWINAIPMVRFVNYAKRTSVSEDGPRNAQKRVVLPQITTDETALKNVVTRYMNNKTIIEGIAESNGVTPLFVVQPVSMYKYDLQYLVFFEGLDQALALVKAGYPFLAAHIAENPDIPNLLWLGDMQENQKKILYVDRIHYNPDLANQIAEKIFTRIEEKKIVPPN